MASVAFYRRDGESQVERYIAAIEADGRDAEVAKMFRYIDLLVEHGADLPQVSSNYALIIDRQARIFELRPQPHRIAYIEHDGAFILLHAWRKQRQALSPKALRHAQAAADEWRNAHP